jgi:hypothetical protein
MVNTGDLKSPAARLAGSSPAPGTLAFRFWFVRIARLKNIAFVAQLVEQLALNETVAGSNPAGGTHAKSHRKVLILYMCNRASRLRGLRAGFEDPAVVFHTFRSNEKPTGCTVPVGEESCREHQTNHFAVFLFYSVGSPSPPERTPWATFSSVIKYFKRKLHSANFSDRENWQNEQKRTREMK